MMKKIIERSGAKVYQIGDNWNEANEKALEATAKDSTSQYIPAFDHPLIWEGHSLMIDEIAAQLKEGQPEESSIVPDAIVVCVGGGGLLKGIQLGCERLKWNNTKIYAVETEGAASYALGVKHGKSAKLDKINSIAVTLGALKVTESVFDTTIQTESVIVSDADAVSACLSFSNDYHMLVEPSCGASLSLLNNSKYYKKYLAKHRNILMVVCGGSAVSLELLQEWKSRFHL
jgi:L-serine/L-threonine ammonia-lyase